jgi:M6 family metalloprotease-like protein
MKLAPPAQIATLLACLLTATAIFTAVNKLAPPKDGQAQELSERAKPHPIIVGQPDGSVLHLNDYSTEEGAHRTTMDGYTVVRHPKDGFYYYAQLAESGWGLVPTETKASAEPPENLQRQIAVEPGMERHKCGGMCGLDHEHGQQQEDTPPIAKSPALNRAGAPSADAPVVTSGYSSLSVNPIGEHTGLTIIVGFPDDPAVAGDQSILPRVENATGGTSVSYVEKLLNQVGFNQNSNIGSVYDYYFYQSGGKFKFYNAVAPEVMLPQPMSYYQNIQTTQSSSAMVEKVIRDSFNVLAAMNYVIPANVTRNASSEIRSLSIMYAGDVSMLPNFASSISTPITYGPVDSVSKFQFSFFFAKQGLGREFAGSGNATFIHECGHLLFYWPDLYDFRSVAPNDNGNGVGRHCIMSYFSSNEKIPSNLNPEFRRINGWATVTEVGVTESLSATLPSTGNVVHRIANTAPPYDSFLIENVGSPNPYATHAGAFPPGGIIIWHVDPSLTHNRDENRTGDPSQPHYHISVKQADGLFELENAALNDFGDAGDYFTLTKPNFNFNTTPSSRFWGSSALHLAPSIQVLGNPGTNIAVNFLGQPPNTLLVNAPQDKEWFLPGDTVPLTWQTNVSGNLRIELYKGGVFHSLIAASVPNDIAHNWTVPLSQPVGSNYKIRISSVNDPAIASFSAGEFAIAEKLDYEGFESGLGNWANSTDLDFFWARHTGNSPQSASGPSGPSAGSWYLITNPGTDTNKLNANAGIVQTFNLSGYTDARIYFDYHMFGGTTNLGRLSVDVFNGSTWVMEVWTRNNQQNAANDTPYTRAMVDLSAYAGMPNVTLRLRVKTSGTTRRVIAIDEVRVLGLPKSLYQIWTEFHTLTGADALVGTDFDTDGLTNLLEFAFGTNPNAGGGGTLAYTLGGAVTTPGAVVRVNLLAGGGVDFRAIFTRRKDHVAAGLTYTVQFSADMTNWVNSADTPTILTGDNTQNPGDIEAVSVPYPLFVPVTGGGYKKPTFFRVAVAMP